jgi:pimeloyl-ACP methyl ester carboxylesterase
MAALEFGPRDRAVDLVFLHANGFNALTYRRILAPAAAAGFRLVAVDQRGHGASSLATVSQGRVDWNDFGDDLIALIDSFEPGGVILAGHSMGGTASLMAAAARPARVASLVLFDPVIMAPDMAERARRGELAHAPLVRGALRRRPEFPSREAAYAAYHGRGAFAGWPDEMLADYIEAGFRDLAGGGVRLACEPEWEASSFTAHAHDPWAAFAALACPARILKAAHASTFHTAGREAELATSGLITIETVPGTSHFLPMERPDLATRALAQALADNA